MKDTDKYKVSETLSVLALACLVLQLVFAEKLLVHEYLHSYFFLFLGGFFLSVSLFSAAFTGFVFIVANIIFRQDLLSWYMALTGGVLMILSFFSLKPDRLISYGWLKLGEGMGFVMSKVILGAIFFLLLTPLSFLYRVFKKDQLRLKKGGDSYYVNRDHLFEKKDLTNTW
ncbi:MAG: SxtJ family membrane protein [Flavobacteriales bacterium]